MSLVVAPEAGTRCTAEECEEVGGNFEAWDHGSYCMWDSRAYISTAFHQTSLSDMPRNRCGHSQVVWVRKSWLYRKRVQNGSLHVRRIHQIRAYNAREHILQLGIILRRTIQRARGKIIIKSSYNQQSQRSFRLQGGELLALQFDFPTFSINFFIFCGNLFALGGKILSLLLEPLRRIVKL